MASNISAVNHTETLQTIIKTSQHLRDIVQSNVNAFLSLREGLLSHSGIQELTVFRDVLFPLIEGRRIEQLNMRVGSDKVHLALCGENSSGKTAFLHRFLDIGKILPSGDGPVTARITKLTYASGEQACIRIRKTLRDATLMKDEISLAEFFAGDKPDWPGIAHVLSPHVKRPEGLAETSSEFADWARCLVEIHIPSPMLARGIEVYDTPGFLLDDAPVLKEILHDLVELIHPTIVFMYANPSTDDATRGCFLAMKAALYDLDQTSIFFLNSKADVNHMSKFKKNMSVADFLSALLEERSRRYDLLLRAPFLANDRLQGLPTTVDQCDCFDVFSVNSQLIKPYGPLMNDATVRRIVQFVANNDFTIASCICKLILPIIDAFFSLLRTASYHTPERLTQLHYDAMNWEAKFFQAYAILTQDCLNSMFTNIFEQFTREADTIVATVREGRRTLDSLPRLIYTAVHLQIIKPAIRETLKKFLNYVLEHIASNSELTRGAVFNDMLIDALGRQQISDFATMLLGDYSHQRPVAASILYMVNTISTPIVQCAQKLRTPDIPHIMDLEALARSEGDDRLERVDRMVREHLRHIEAAINDLQASMRQATKVWGEQQQATVRSLIDVHYQTASPLLHSQQTTLKGLQDYVGSLIVIECKLRAAQDAARFCDRSPQIHRQGPPSTTFSLATADWGDEKNLVVKKLPQPVADQPHAAYYEAHYHLRVASLGHPSIVHIRYLYEYLLDDATSELWMVFPPMLQSLERFLQHSTTLLPVRRVLTWMLDVADALAILHQNELVHRNVSPTNIVLSDDDRALLVDLGGPNDLVDRSVGHEPAATPNGMNDDIKGLAEVGSALLTRLERDESVMAIIDQFAELIHECTEASQKKSITADFVREKLAYTLTMF